MEDKQPTQKLEIGFKPPNSKQPKFIGSKFVHFGEKLGKGAFGSVYKGYFVKTGKMVAIKKINNVGKEERKKQQERKYQEQEIQILQYLSKVQHKNIVTLYDVIIVCLFNLSPLPKKNHHFFAFKLFFLIVASFAVSVFLSNLLAIFLFSPSFFLVSLNLTNLLSKKKTDNKEKLFLVLEYCSKGDLGGYLAKQPENRISEEEAKKWMKQLASGLQVMKQPPLKILHRDIKPNVLF